jgi:hypothetical protein
MRKLRKYLKSPDFGVKLLIGSVIVQGFHSYFVFADLSNFTELPKIISSIFYAIVLSCAILYYTMINRRIVALRFQVFESGINLYYFFKSVTLLLMGYQISWVEVIPRSIIAIGIAIILPYTIFEYAGSVSIETEEETQKEEIELSNYMKEKVKLKARQDILQQISSIDDVKKLTKKYLKDE